MNFTEYKYKLENIIGENSFWAVLKVHLDPLKVKLEFVVKRSIFLSNAKAHLALTSYIGLRALRARKRKSAF